MSEVRLEFGEVRMSLANVGEDSGRAQAVSRLTFEHLQEMVSDTPDPFNHGARIDHLNAGAVQVSFESMDDATIARASARAIYRALLLAL